VSPRSVDTILTHRPNVVLFHSAAIGETNGVVSADTVMTTDFAPKVEGKEDIMRKLERKTHGLFEESTVLARKRDFARAVDAATAAIQTERQLSRLRDEDNPDNVNTDITYAVMLNLGSIYQQAGMHSKALKQFEDVVSNKQLGNSGRLRINIGNILFSQKKYLQAIKMYRRGLDQIPVSTNQRLRSKVMRSIGHAFCELRQFEEAAKAYQLVLSEPPVRDCGGGVERKVPSRDFCSAFNMLLCHYVLAEQDKMQSSFITLLQQELQVSQDDER
jgi:tetratricopeptide (TPR) repeat protein